MGGDTLMMQQQDLFEVKRCGKCGETKAINEFYKHKRSKDGLNSICKSCRGSYDNPNRMWVNGKYVPRSHPLYKPGRYKTFEDAAFSSLAKYETSVEGQVYIITNPNFEGWVKVGMAIDSEDRLNGYQTSSPFRDYHLHSFWDVSNRRSAEAAAHTELEKTYERRGEWFKCTPEQATEVVSNITEEYK
jgi:hypothetical protein